MGHREEAAAAAAGRNGERDEIEKQIDCAAGNPLLPFSRLSLPSSSLPSHLFAPPLALSSPLLIREPINRITIARTL